MIAWRERKKIRQEKYKPEDIYIYICMYLCMYKYHPSRNPGCLLGGAAAYWGGAITGGGPGG